jgi:hypothetical protein
LARIAALHLPGAVKGQSASDSQPRVVYVDIFERWWFDKQEKAMLAFRLGNKEVVCSFQLNTKVLADEESRPVNLTEAESMFWCTSAEGHSSKAWYVTMSRVDDLGLDPNPWLLDTLRSQGDNNFTEGSLPWFGDVFVIPTEYDEEGKKDWLNLSLEPDVINLKECESALCSSVLSDYNGTVRYAALRNAHSGYINKALRQVNMSMWRPPMEKSLPGDDL